MTSSTLASSQISSTSTILAMPTMPDPIMKCLRCTNLSLQCNVDPSVPGHSKYLCHQCVGAGLDCCIFPPAIRLINTQSNSRCISCTEHHTKCIFLNATDSQCTRCSKRHLPCCFTLNGKCIISSNDYLLLSC